MRVGLQIKWLPVFFAAAVSLQAADRGEPNLALKKVEAALQPILAGLNPPPEIAYQPGGQSLVVSYRTRTYQVHGRSKSGERSQHAQEEVGPGFTGFVLKVHAQDAGQVNQALTPQTIRNPYWNTLLDLTPVAGTDQQIYWGLSPGGRTDPLLTDRIGKTLRALAPPQPAPQANSVPSPQAVPAPARATSTLEGVLQVHPKYLFKYYLTGFADGQQCALLGEGRLKDLEVGSRIQVSGQLVTRFHAGGSAAHPSPFGKTWYIAMEVDRVKVLGTPGQ